MNSEEKFEQIYAKIVERYSKELEKSRELAQNKAQEGIRKFAYYLIIFFVELLLAFIAIFIFKNLIIEVIIGYLLIISLLVFIFKIMRNTRKKDNPYDIYEEEYKNKAINYLIELYNENMKYYPNEGIESRDYSNAEFEKYELYESNNLIQGKINNNSSFYMSRVHTEDTTLDENNRTKYYTIFNGIFIKIENSMTIRETLYLRSDSRDNPNKNFLKKVFRTKLPFDKLRIEMDSREFEEKYDVYCSSDIFNMQLFTADIMQSLIELDRNIEITIKDNNIYLRFKDSGNLFKTPILSKNSLDKEALYKHYKVLDFSFILSRKILNIIENMID